MSICDWLRERRAATQVSVTPIPWSENQEWGFKDGALCHRTGKFFSVRGVREDYPDETRPTRDFPLINQPEIGLLGFLITRTKNGPQWLLQAKAEPGTEHNVQIGPSVQATKSNYSLAHGGRPTPYLDEFLDHQDELLTSVEQSEQGTRFIGKFNWNAVRELPQRTPPTSDNWRWFSAQALKKALTESFMVNTDSRSVIACAPWGLLCENGAPFAPRKSDAHADRRDALFRSLMSSASIVHIPETLEKIANKPRARYHLIPIEEMQDWQITDDAIAPLGDADYDVQSYRIELPGREKDFWDQPLLCVRSINRALLLARESDYGAEFFFRIAHEPGFGGRPQLGPSWQSDGVNPDWLSDSELDRAPLLSLRQSDEGGRFMRSIVSYEIIHLGECSEESDGFWLTLSQLRKLCNIRGMLTNEARTLISMLLSYA